MSKTGNDPGKLMFTGCYSLHLYCDTINENHEFEEFPHEYAFEHGSQCRSIARLKGWVLHRDGYATCPKCSKSKHTPN